MKIKKELTIKEEQQIHLRILRLFSVLCESENIQYFAGYGTLLGAVREHGFIDWDDDIDLWIKRKDIPIFVKNFYKYFDKEKYFLQSYETDKNCLSPEMYRICVNNTFKWNENIHKEMFHTGIYFDIFPLDYGFDNEDDKLYLTEFTKRHAKLYSNLKLKWSRLQFKEKVIYIYNHLNSRQNLSRKVREISDIYTKNPESSIFVCVPTSYFGYQRCCFNVEDFSSNIMLKFENMEVSCPVGYERVLCQLYGEDYMISKVTKSGRHKAFLIE